MAFISMLTDSDIVSPKANRAFGVDQSRPHPYSLRQARYFELGSDIARWAWEHYQKTGMRLQLLDVGTHDGVLRKYIEIFPGSEYVRFEAADLYTYGVEFVYKHTEWDRHHFIDLNIGMESIASDSYDVVVCEQVLEHLKNPHLAMSELARVTRPGGILAIGVPIFPAGMHLAKRHILPVTDRIFNIKKIRGHIQAWCKRGFIRELRECCPEMEIRVCRGFRIASGGVIGPLEFLRWWWQLNRFVGRRIPSLCVEIQILAVKKKTSFEESETK